MKLPLVGPYAKGRHAEVNAREAVNLYCERVDDGGKEQLAWVGTPGLKAFGSPTAVVRGKPLEWDDTLYYVAGTKLYSMNSAGTETELATLSSNSGNNVSISRNRTQLLIVDGTKRYYVWDTGTSELVVVNKFSTESDVTDIQQISSTTITDIVNTAGDVYRVTSTTHAGVTGDYVTITGTTSFNNDYSITWVDGNNFDITQTGSPADETTISGTSQMHRYTVSAADNNVTNDENVRITGTTNFDGLYVKPWNAATNTFTIGGALLETAPADETTITSANAYAWGDAITITPSMGAVIDGYGLLNNTADTSDDENGVSKQAFFRTRADDFTTIQALHYSAAQFDPDDLLAIFVTGGDIWLLGKNSAELWFNNGTDADFPLEPARSAAIPYGIAAPWSITEMGTGVAWLARSSHGEIIPVVAEGYQPNPVANHGIAYQINSATSAQILAATAQSYEEEGHRFWVLTLGGNTWTYDHAESKATGMKLWHKRESYDGTSYEQFRGKWYVRAFDKHLWTDRENAKILEADLDTFTELDNATSRAIRRYGVSGYVHSDDGRTFHDRLGILMAATSGTLDISYSDDAGTTWTAHLSGTSFARLVETHQLGMAEVDRLYKVQTSSAVRVCIVGAFLDVRGEDADA
jgi:hypothetical protein